MDKLKDLLYSLYKKEISDLRIGYSFNKQRLKKMMEIEHAIFFLENSELESREAIRIIEKYID